MGHNADMRISAKVDYAVRALVAIARSEQDGPAKADAIATEQHIPRNFLLVVLGDLRRAGIVTSQRGQAGGWHLAKSPDGISVADVIRAADGPLVSVHGTRPEDVEYDQSVEVLQRVWIAVRSSLREVLERVTIADLSDGRLPDSIAWRTEDDEVWKAR